MSTPIIIHATISGPAAFLDNLAATDFDINVFYPMPAGTPDQKAWRFVYWGTTDVPHDVVVNYTPGDISMNVSFMIEGSMPYGILLYLVKEYPELEFVFMYDIGNGETIGRMVSDNGISLLQQIYPIYFRRSIVKALGETSDWFDADSYIASIATRGVTLPTSRSATPMTYEEKQMTHSMFVNNRQNLVSSAFF